MKSEIPFFPIGVIFIGGYVSEVVIISYNVGFICIPIKLGFAYFITVQSYDVRK